MAEQDRLGSHLGGPSHPANNDSRLPRTHMPQGSGAEQDRYGGWFGGDKGRTAVHSISEKLPQTSGAEQDRYEGWFGGDKGAAAAQRISERLPHTSGAEQDRYNGWFGKDKGPATAHGISDKLPQTSGAEQDRFGGWFGGGKGSAAASEISERFPRASGAEQDRFGSHFSSRPNNPINPVNATAVGLLQSAILPSFGLHAGLSTITYGIARYADRAEGKDWLWPSAPVVNAWWSAVGTRVVYDGLSLSQAWSTLAYPEKILLTGVSAWGVRLFYRIASRGVKRGADDPRYAQDKKDPQFWNKAFFTSFLPEAVVQTLISLPFTLPFRAGTAASASVSPALPSSNLSSLVHGLAVFLFTTGFAMEILADAQLESHKQKNNGELNREGVWSIVRHPNYLGDALVHFSFPVLLLGAGLLHPLAGLGPLANYAFLRFVGGDKENEESQEKRYVKENPLKLQQLREYRREKNSFWPSPREASNSWTWIVLGAGAGGVLLERGLRAALR
ncbi:hypothetical protein DL766_003357 [Monosporascus sp. MC13-8B]|uniref:Steroid 5-alpha reductase C-terminal domain-containing protein n=1 Tax=Monosporascus cannonballus TaxID=155416 RepID=A0ABY0HDK9_9PEZI|nr:hypothetical protein DL762_002375 [Monosporascus cannonballus]RYO99203.1 hypothetical protein DL763_001693 [Monosporascus cannonballus]RYP33608.1 hypothetical protein DL766_003357 [Monosporascus sp. MC13-8B]